MPALEIHDDQLAPLRGKVVVITGGSSGIGLATAHKLLQHGAVVVAGDLAPPKDNVAEDERFTFCRTDVTVWRDLVALFKQTRALHGRVDHVFANAGIGRALGESYVDDDDDDAHADPLEPDHRVLQVNLVGVMNTARLAIHHFKRQQPAGGSIVITGSGSSYGRFSPSEYASSKHAVLGFMRSLSQQIWAAKLPIRVNLVAPFFTDTSIIEADRVRDWGFPVQPAEVVARSAGYLMADERCDQQLIASQDSRYWEIEGELLEAARKATGGGIKRTAESATQGQSLIVTVDGAAG